MTNVMTYLAARSLRGVHAVPADDGAPMPVVRPRLPSPYEFTGRQPQIAIEEIDQENASGEPEPAALRTEPAARRTAPEVVADLSPRAPVTPIKPAVTPRPPSAVSEAPAPPIIAPNKTRALPTATQPAGPPTAPNRAGDATSPAAHMAPLTAAPLAPRATPPGANDRAPFRSAPPRDSPHSVAEHPTHDPLPLARLVSASNSPITPRPLKVGVARIDPHVSLQPTAPPKGARLRDATESSRTPPRVQVTIGRLEIRATTTQPPTPSRRVAPRPPALSLDDYLAARSKT